MPKLYLCALLAGLACAQTPEITGQWKRVEGRGVSRLELLPDATGVFNGLPLQWTIRNGNELTLLGRDGSIQTAAFKIAGKKLILVSLGRRMEFEREAPSARPSPDAPKPAPCSTVAGTWRGPEGAVVFGEDGTAMIAGVRYRYTADADAITLTNPDGVLRAPYRLAAGVLTLMLKGQPAMLVCAPRTESAPVPVELAGRWRRQTDAGAAVFFTFYPDGTYQYTSETASPSAYGPTVTSENDHGAWTATADTITLRSRTNGAVTTWPFEKRNHPQSNAPMLVLDGQPYVAFGPRAPW